jgi:uncharacterized membrane protein YbhN (UPF0104 family)
MASLKSWLKPASYLVVAAVFFFLIRSLFQNWQGIDWNKINFNPFYLAFSLVLAFTGLLISIYLMTKILASLREEVTYWQALRIMGKSQLAKYLPGGVWMTASRVYLAEQEKLSKPKVLLGTLVEQEYGFVIALVLSIFCLGFRGSLLAVDLTGFNLLFLLLAVVFLNPISLTYLLKFGMKLARLDYPDWRFSFRLYFILLLGYSFCWILQAVGFFFLAKSFYNLDFAWLKRFLGIYLFSWVLGFVAIFAPGGLGIREGSMALFLKSYFPPGFAISLSLIGRVWITILELLLALLAFAKKEAKVYKQYEE